MEFYLKTDSDREDQIREKMNRARENGSLDHAEKQILEVAGEILGKLEKMNIKACPCTTGFVLSKLTPEQIQASIIIFSRLAALEYLTPGNDESEFIRLLHHALTRRDEIFADTVLAASELVENEKPECEFCAETDASKCPHFGE